MATVKFNSVDEFVDELRFDTKVVEPPPFRILRLTNLMRDTNTLPIRHLSVLATIKSLRSPDDIIRLERFCGQIWGIASEDESTYKRSETIFQAIEAACKELNIEVRPGMFEEKRYA